MVENDAIESGDDDDDGGGGDYRQIVNLIGSCSSRQH